MSVFLTQVHEKFINLEQHLNMLDAATGDGDHGSAMVRGLAAAAHADDQPEKAFRRAAGGASGALFAVLIGALDRATKGDDLAQALTTAAQRISLMGMAKQGDKTMLDALIPAAQDANPARAAQQGAEATRAMTAQKGRARYVEGAGVGHLDAGAVSVAELLAVYEVQI